MTDLSKRVIVRGWADICEITGCADFRSAMKELKSLGLLKYNGRQPYLSVDAYKIACYERQRGG